MDTRGKTAAISEYVPESQKIHKGKNKNRVASKYILKVQPHYT